MTEFEKTLLSELNRIANAQEPKPVTVEGIRIENIGYVLIGRRGMLKQAECPLKSYMDKLFHCNDACPHFRDPDSGATELHHRCGVWLVSPAAVEDERVR